MLAKTKLLLVGAGAAAAAAGAVFWARHRAHAARAHADGPSQDTIDALDALALDDEPVLQADIDALDDLLNVDASPEIQPDDYVEVDVIIDDVGELYGVHTPRASDTDLGEGDSFRGGDDGDNWLESLETSAAEGGPAPEQEVDPIDEVPHPHTDTRDRPVADKGSGGRGGL